MKLRYAALSLLICVAASAAESSKPSPALQALNMFAGTWKCKGTQTMTGVEIPYTQTVTGKWTLDGHWLDVQVVQQKSASNPAPSNGRALMGWDAGSRTYVMAWVDNSGGYENATSLGWQGDKISWEGVVHFGAMSPRGRDIFIKASVRKIIHTLELQQDGKWVEVMNETCTR